LAPKRPGKVEKEPLTGKRAEKDQRQEFRRNQAIYFPRYLTTSTDPEFIEDVYERRLTKEKAVVENPPATLPGATP
jgi:hypothetical protein